MPLHLKTTCLHRRMILHLETNCLSRCTIFHLKTKCLHRLTIVRLKLNRPCRCMAFHQKKKKKNHQKTAVVPVTSHDIDLNAKHIRVVEHHFTRARFHRCARTDITHKLLTTSNHPLRMNSPSTTIPHDTVTEYQKYPQYKEACQERTPYGPSGRLQRYHMSL